MGTVEPPGCGARQTPVAPHLLGVRIARPRARDRAVRWHSCPHGRRRQSLAPPPGCGPLGPCPVWPEPGRGIGHRNALQGHEEVQQVINDSQ